MKFFKQLMCEHDYEFIPLNKPFFGYPMYDNDGYWIKDLFLHKCRKCEKLIWKDDYEVKENNE